MNPVTVVGRFITPQNVTVDGDIKFIPSRVWFDHDGETYPSLAPEVKLVNGEFAVQLTPTDTTEFPWRYTVVCPVGSWSIQIPTTDEILLLKDLLPKKFA